MRNSSGDILSAITSLMDENGNQWPTVRAIAKRADLRSTNTVAYHINRLLEDGSIELDNRARVGTYRIVNREVTA